MMRVDRIQRALHGISASEAGTIFKLFGHWPVPKADVEIPGDCLCAIWLADYIATMGILDQAMRSVLLEQLKPRIASWGPAGPAPTDHDDCCVRIADRKFLFFEGTDGRRLNLATGEIFEGLPKVPPIDKLILDVYALFVRRQTSEPADATDDAHTGVQ